MSEEKREKRLPDPYKIYRKLLTRKKTRKSKESKEKQK